MVFTLDRNVYNIWAFTLSFKIETTLLTLKSWFRGCFVFLLSVGIFIMFQIWSMALNIQVYKKMAFCTKFKSAKKLAIFELLAGAAEVVVDSSWGYGILIKVQK